jgi:hypothetical protein
MYFTANGLKSAFVIVQISRFQQIIDVFTLQAPSDAVKVSSLNINGFPDIVHNFMIYRVETVNILYPLIE